MSAAERRRIRAALASRDREISARGDELAAAMEQSDPAAVPADTQIKAIARSLRDSYSVVADAVDGAGVGGRAVAKLIEGLEDYSNAYRKLARGFAASDEAAVEATLGEMQELFTSGDEKIAAALERIGI